MFDKILIANRGEIACRVIKTARKMGIKTVAIYSDADKQALHVQMADEAVHIGPPPANQSYIVIDKVMEAIRQSGAQAVHPGYGFLSENSKFAEALAAEGVAFVGPPVGAIESMGDKITSKKIAQEANVSTVPGYMGLIEDADEAVKISNEIGYPVMIKASAGGGGKGMRIAWNDEEAREGFQSSKNEAANSFGDDRIFIEKFVTQPRHIEIQVLCDTHGNGIYLGERECSIQRRNQKVVEEAPSPFLDEATRKAMGEQAVALAKAVGYASAGTVEFIVDGDKNFYFLEMNTRLQVEHPVTELITGVDLVEQMIRVAGGEPLSITQDDVKLTGWAIENRLYAEDPYRNFLPSIGRLTRYRPPAEQASGPLLENGKWQGDAPEGPVAVRNDTGVYEGGEISMYYDPMIAKLCTWAPTREAAIAAMRDALDGFEVEGIGHNLPFLSAVMDHPKFVSGDMTTAFIAEEYPDGFEGVELPEAELRRIAAATAAMHRVAEIRRTRVSGRMDNHERKVGTDWVVTLQGQSFDVTIEADPSGSTVRFADGETVRVASDWTPGDQLARVSTDDSGLVLKVGKISGGFRIRSRGADLKVHVRTPRQAELARLMPEKLPPDTSKMLLCPMPGLIVKVDVEVGQEVQEGQPLCTVEAMKMENILRAERKGIVSKVNASAGDSLAVDDVIMEFE
ncbi:MULTISPECIES: acetyl-CoA carboxylase biotin carboxylase subunit [Rhodobacterales]|jgi:propionyl-CoA carboxylase alpha chain|uniref:acetyl-CoA carboxylase biotin carboxylase subunit n=1 Tax=Rhodobacterales TaxID=204455 RepID=UPI00237FB4CD|nr:acetyl/propionyl/methylcrotonyl-CoA carboxylase subunit alpha [Phaeobacter gallaeciensis]MDE4142436.1 acetyl/propionyl/methylcrotonyl-CoA carboxylase subunit alpha [Phaeobacter gallaeciensis]MDE4150928.1 acetyl/propionyl/methylcrotonyl-CoA carboxylase subunit alpha [Phaeobacter gallaeciensis]MDE4155110.1 acetyl/propionyl/methylcrotonyl-CoA carboxylase subunit alpha [Phaeobacter gallaeciensis]MDE4230547.1 acetyl/propionyl/methylcrotonyl-CoA carboxylase subunit alpha [Phaeobacter gallaeciensis